MKILKRILIVLLYISTIIFLIVWAFGGFILFIPYYIITGKIIWYEILKVIPTKFLDNIL